MNSDQMFRVEALLTRNSEQLSLVIDAIGYAIEDGEPVTQEHVRRVASLTEEIRQLLTHLLTQVARLAAQ